MVAVLEMRELIANNSSVWMANSRSCSRWRLIQTATVFLPAIRFDLDSFGFRRLFLKSWTLAVRFVSHVARLPAAVLFTNFTIFLTSPFFSLPQRFIYFLMSLNRSQPAYAADGVGCFLQVLRISHVKLLCLLFDGEHELTAL